MLSLAAVSRQVPFLTYCIIGAAALISCHYGIGCCQLDTRFPFVSLAGTARPAQSFTIYFFEESLPESRAA